MKDKAVGKIHEIASHRNGVTGNGFHAIRFRGTSQATDGMKDEMLAIVFPEQGNCAIISLDLLKKCGVKFGCNSWRGDVFEAELRQAIDRR